jgi:ribosomal protein RSM22 (predicted rRNA methylase)
MKRPTTLSKDDLNALAADVLRLSRLLTREREALPAAYLKDRSLRRAYLLYFLPANLSKVHTPLRELALHPMNLLRKERLRVLDIGSGPGTAVLGVLGFFARQEQRPIIESTAVDQVGENLREAEALFRERRTEYGIDASLRTVKTGIERLAARLGGGYDITILSNVLNELFHGDPDRIAKRTELLKNMLDRCLAPDGSAVIIEPALRETSRELLEVGCRLSAAGFTFYAPCPAAGLCAVLENPRDWHHEEVPWDPPVLIREIDRRTGLRKDTLKFSYLVLRKDRLSLADVFGADSYRVVSEPLVSKGKIEFFLCGREGRRRVIRLDKDGTSSNKAFGDLRRGDIVRFMDVVDEGKRFRIGKGTSVGLVLPVGHTGEGRGRNP